MFSTDFDFNHIKNCFQNSNIFFLVSIDAQGQYTYLNECFAARYKEIYGDITGREAVSTIHPADIQDLVDAAHLCRLNPQKSASVTLRKKDGVGGYFVSQWDLKYDARTGNIVAMGFDISEFQNKQLHIDLLNSTMRDIASVQSHMVRRPFANILALVDMLEINETDRDNYLVLKLLRKSCQELNEEFNKFTITMPIAV